MTLFIDNSNNSTIVSPDDSDILSSRMRYLHPEYVDEKLESIYAQSRCPLSMLAETCKNVGKPLHENPTAQLQEPSVSISPSCGSSCSAPKFSPHSVDCSPVEQLKFIDESNKEKSLKDKPKKRKSQKKEPEIANKRQQYDPQVLHSNYAISEFLKSNNFGRDSFVKPEQINVNNHIFHNISNPNNSNHFNHLSSIWKSKLSPTSRMPFPMNCLPNSYPPQNIPTPSSLYRIPPSNMLHDMSQQLYNHCPIDKTQCECPGCTNPKVSLDKNLLKMDPFLFNFFQGLRKERQLLNPNLSLLAFLQNSNISASASTIRYCMYCGQCIPVIQNLLSHIHTEHFDCINSSFCPKIEQSAGNFSSNFSVASLQSKEVNANELNALKNIELLKQLQFMYNIESQRDNCIDKTVLMK